MWYGITITFTDLCNYRAISNSEKLRLSYLSPVRDSEVVYHEHVPLLPAIEHQVPPHCVPNMAHCTIRYGRPIAIASVHPKA